MVSSIPWERERYASEAANRLIALVGYSAADGTSDRRTLALERAASRVASRRVRRGGGELRCPGRRRYAADRPAAAARAGRGAEDDRRRARRPPRHPDHDPVPRAQRGAALAALPRRLGDD